MVLLKLYDHMASIIYFLEKYKEILVQLVLVQKIKAVTDVDGQHLKDGHLIQVLM